MSPQRPLEQRLHTFSVRLSTASDVAEGIPAILNPPKMGNPKPVGDGESLFGNYVAWQNEVDEKCYGTLRATKQFTDLVKQVARIVHDESPKSGREEYLHGCVYLCPEGLVPFPGKNESVYAALAKHHNVRVGLQQRAVASGSRVTSLTKPKMRKAYVGERTTLVAVRPSETVLEVMPGYERGFGEAIDSVTRDTGMRPHYAKLWALSPSEGTADDNYLFECSMSEIRINPRGVPARLQEKVVAGWNNFLRDIDYNIVDIATRRVSKEMPAYADRAQAV